ncbi:MAG: hypothetical protein H6822_10485 [Planctomycetaceae bacterium]|nr:hypothetical protein [Planctomycetales bacterium]MCB9922599.1 hypothetical protein [Planctomycetaceae bacterium]
MEEISFVELLNRVRHGDSAAAGQLIEEYEDVIRREIRFSLFDWRLRRVADESDICQSVMLRFLVRVWSGSFEFEKPNDLINLLKTMVRARVADLHRHCTAQRRDVRRTQPFDSGIPTAAKTPAPDSAVLRANFLADFERRLDEPQRTILKLRRDGLNWVQIAERIDQTTDRADAIRKRFERAVARVSTELGIEL